MAEQQPENAGAQKSYSQKEKAMVEFLTRQRSWVERDLCVGDLRALSDIASGRVDPDFDQVDRLCERGFLAKTRKGRARMTLKGWVAIILRNTIAKSR